MNLKISAYISLCKVSIYSPVLIRGGGLNNCTGGRVFFPKSCNRGCQIMGEGVNSLFFLNL